MSGQIRSVWKWYHWKGLGKDINRYMFLIFNFDLEFWKDLKFWASKYKNRPPISSFFAGGLYRILSFLLLAHFPFLPFLYYFGLYCGLLEIFKYSTYKPASKHKIYSSRIFGGTDWRKRLRFVHIQPSCLRSRMIRWNFAWSSSELWTLIRKFQIKIKNKNLWRLLSFSRPKGIGI